MFGPTASPWRSNLLSSYAALVASSPQKSQFPSQRSLVLSWLLTSDYSFDTTAIKATALIISYYLILGFLSHPSPLDRQQGILIPTSDSKLSSEAKF